MRYFEPLPGPLETVLRRILPENRFRWSLAASLLAHLLLILGLGFTLPRIAERALNAPLRITLVSRFSEERPDTATIAAQANSRGGGNSESPRIAASPPVPLPDRDKAAEPAMGSFETEIPALPVPQPVGAKTPLLAAADGAYTLPAEKALPPGSRPAGNLRQRLLADLGSARRTVQQGLREKYLGSRTFAYRYAPYMEQWRERVEEIGNLNYPEEARRFGLSGSLVLDVGIRPDGRIDRVRVVRSSGSKVLDDAAARIVFLAAPFAPFPDSFRNEVDVLHLVRTWEFLHDRLRSK